MSSARPGKPSQSTFDSQFTEFPPAWYRDRVLLGVMGLALLLGLVYNFTILLGPDPGNPQRLIGYGPDEPRHMNYVRLLYNERQFPYIEPGTKVEHASAHTLHPPLYYLILLPFYTALKWLPEATLWHLLRGISLLLCLATLPLIYRIAWYASEGDVNVSRLAAAQVGLLPIFGMIAGVINNDSLTLFVTALFVWLLVERERDKPVTVGICLGLGGIVKATTLLCNGATLAVYFAWQYAFRILRGNRLPLRAGIILALGLAFSAPWYVRNVMLYGQFTPIERGYTFGQLPPPEAGFLMMLFHPNFPAIFVSAVKNIFFTMWVQVDWVPEVLRQPIYWMLLLYITVALAGMVRWWVLRRKEITERSVAIETRIANDASGAAFLITGLACLTIAMFVHFGWAQGGRYLLPALFGLSIFLARGWRGVVGSRNLPVVLAGWSLFAMAFNAIAIYQLITDLNPKVWGGTDI